MDGINSSLSALRAASTSLSVTSNNIANVNTTGFRSDSVHLQTGPGGRGVNVAAISESQRPGPVNFTGQSLDLAATGDSFFTVRRPDGGLAFTRDGNFNIDGSGNVVTPQGNLLDPKITVPPDAQGVSIGRDGTVSATLSDGSNQQIGSVQPVTFPNSDGLTKVGDNLFLPSPNSGAATRASGSEVLQGALELSNTDIAEQMVNLIKDENFNAVNVAAAKTEDEIMGTILDLKR